MGEGSSTTPLHEKVFASDRATKLPMPFILRRLHSVLGVWMAFYLFEHLLVNSRVAFYFQDDGSGFIKMVNQIHALPYLKVVEALLLGLPFLIHAFWGVLYAIKAKLNATRGDGRKPALPQYVRNRAFSWQRITSWILLVFILGHVVQMRFLDYPVKVQRGMHKSYLVALRFDKGLYGVADKLGVTLYTHEALRKKSDALLSKVKKLEELEKDIPKTKQYFVLYEQMAEDREWLEGAKSDTLKKGKIVAETPDAGTAFLLIVRNTFKSPLMVILYSILVVAAAYHGFNGLWTFCITWGVTLTRRSQARLRRVIQGLIILVTAMGLAAAWATYYIVQLQNSV